MSDPFVGMTHKTPIINEQQGIIMEYAHTPAVEWKIVKAGTSIILHAGTCQTLGEACDAVEFLLGKRGDRPKSLRKPQVTVR